MPILYRKAQDLSNKCNMLVSAVRRSEMQSFNCGCQWVAEARVLVYRVCGPHKLVLDGIGEPGFLYPPDVPVNQGGLHCCYCHTSTRPVARVVFREVVCKSATTGIEMSVWRPFCPSCTAESVVIP